MATAGETACPTYFAKRLIQQGGAGGFACRSNGLNQWSASKLNKFPKTVMHPVRIFVEIFRLAKPQTETKVDEGEERRDFDPLAGSELPEGIEEINKFRPLMEDVRYVLLKRYAISAWARRPRSHRPVSGEFSKLYSHRPSVCLHGCGMPETRRLAFRIQIQHSAEAKNADPSHFLSAATRWQSTMRILHLDSGLSMRGGQWQALRLAEGLRQAGHTVTVLSRESSPCLEMARGLGLDAEPLTAGSVRRFSGQADL